MRIIFILSLLIAPLSDHVGKDMMRFFNKLGGSSNVSDPAVYKDSP